MREQARRTAEGMLFTDQYQLTMAQLYFRQGMHEKPAQFEHFFRKYPDYGSHQAGYCINAGLEWLLDRLATVRFTASDLDYLRNQRTGRGAPLFGTDFLAWLAEHGNFRALSLRAIPEGRVVHANVPLTVVTGPLALAQILESSLLNILNFQTLIATKAARLRASAQGGGVLEFGLRRAHDRGANAGVRGALIGGADFSSNAGISHALGLPPKGTHAHSMVQAFMAMGGSELDAFRAYAEVYSDDCLLLVDTIDTLGSGIPNAIRVFEELRKRGHRPLGVRLDSGDLAYLAIHAARMLDRAGFPEARIVLSNELDELVIWQIITQIREEAERYGVEPEALIARLIYGVGTRLITSRGASALDGVYKLTALGGSGGWQPAIKISEDPAKTLNPGDKQAWRLYDQEGFAVADLLCRRNEKPGDAASLSLRHPTEPGKFRELASGTLSRLEPLLVEIVRAGRRVHRPPPLEELRRQRERDEEALHPGVKRLVNPHRYHVSLSEQLWDLKRRLVAAARSDSPR